MDTFQTSDERAPFRSFFIHEASYLQFCDSMAICCANVLLVRLVTEVRLEVWHLSSSLNVCDAVWYEKTVVF